MISRPLRWGFFVLAGVIIVLLAVRFGWTNSMTSGWDASEAERRSETASEVLTAFQQRADRLTVDAASIASDTSVLDLLTSNVPERVIEGNDRLAGLRRGDVENVDIIDFNGTPLAWVGLIKLTRVSMITTMTAIVVKLPATTKVMVRFMIGSPFEC